MANQTEQLFAELFPEDDTEVVRAVAIASIDGYLTRSGRAGGLGGEDDARLMSFLRRSAEIILVGANTAEIEQYAYPLLFPQDIEWRREHNLSDEPQIGVLSRSANPPALARLSIDSPVPPRAFHEPGFATAAIQQLRSEGTRRIIVEGGPTVWNDLIQAGELDELSLTISPNIIGDANEVHFHQHASHLILLGSVQVASFIVVRYAFE